MTKAVSTLAAALTLMMTGCASGPPFIDAAQPEALAMAQRRAQFEMNCPDATVTVLSRETLQPVSFRFGVVRAEYTIGAAGCGKRATYVVMCPQDGPGCFAAGGRTEIK